MWRRSETPTKPGGEKLQYEVTQKRTESYHAATTTRLKLKAKISDVAISAWEEGFQRQELSLIDQRCRAATSRCLFKSVGKGWDLSFKSQRANQKLGRKKRKVEHTQKRT